MPKFVIYEYKYDKEENTNIYNAYDICKSFYKYKSITRFIDNRYNKPIEIIKELNKTNQYRRLSNPDLNINIKDAGDELLIPALLANNYVYTFGNTDYEFEIDKGDNDNLVLWNNFLYTENKNTNIKDTMYYPSNNTNLTDIDDKPMLSSGLLFFDISDPKSVSQGNLYYLDNASNNIIQDKVSIEYDKLINYNPDNIVNFDDIDINKDYSVIEHYYNDKYIIEKLYTIPFAITLYGLYIPATGYNICIDEYIAKDPNTDNVLFVYKIAYLNKEKLYKDRITTYEELFGKIWQ